MHCLEGLDVKYWLHWKIVVMKKCTDNFQVYKVFGTLYKHMILIKLLLLQAKIKKYFCTGQEGEF